MCMETTTLATKIPFWPSENVTTTPHSAAAIIADAVVLLSNPPATSAVYQTPTTNTGWTDLESFRYPANPVSNRPSNTSYYRTAIAAGKEHSVPTASVGGADMGTDGGMHNLLRYLENRGANGATVNYAGSMISMYYCCNVLPASSSVATRVYGAPQRNYFFDSQFPGPVEPASWNAHSSSDVVNPELPRELHPAVSSRI